MICILLCKFKEDPIFSVISYNFIFYDRQVLEERVNEVESFFCEETSNVAKDDFGNSTKSVAEKSALDPDVSVKLSEREPLALKEHVGNFSSTNISDTHNFPIEYLNKESNQASSNISSSETNEMKVIPVLNKDNVKDIEDELVVIPSESASSEVSNQSRYENIKRLSIANKASLKPTLSNGKPGDMLDLDDEKDVPERKNSEQQKVQNLIERFVQQVNYTKQGPKERDIEIQ